MAIVLATINIYPVFMSQELVFRSKTASLQSKAAVAASALTGLDSLTAEGVGQVMDLLDDMNLTRLIIVDSDALVLYDTGSTATGKYALFPEIYGALLGNDVFYSVFEGDSFESRAAIPVIYRNNAIGAVYVYEHDAEQGALLINIQNTIKNMSVIVTLAFLLVSFIFSAALTGKIAALLRSIRIVGEGEYEHRVSVKGNDELSALADEFNKMTDKLQVTEEARQRFVSDASHELKTPLASIKLLTDSILQNEDIDVDMTREFVADIGSEADRLARITEKLLGITRMDYSGVSSQADIVDIKQILLSVLHTLRPFADAHSVELKSTMADGCEITASGDDIHQLAFNLVENAIKYNTPGGWVQVLLFRRGRETILIVEDTGIGIPKEDMPRIFERFYRVDKARSRDGGGTGLGLSIVRDAAVKNGGTVTVEPREPSGSRFTVVFREPDNGTSKEADA